MSMETKTDEGYVAMRDYHKIDSDSTMSREDIVSKAYSDILDTINVTKGVGIKYDGDKIRYSLLPWREIEDVVKVLEFGSKKYSDDNWKKMPDIPNRYFNAAMRHLIDYRTKGKLDSETNISHLAHCVCCLLFMMWYDNETESHSDSV